MAKKLTNMDETKCEDHGSWRFLDLSGEQLGIRLEETPPGGSSSVRHYHALEEEHVIVLEGGPDMGRKLVVA